MNSLQLMEVANKWMTRGVKLVYLNFLWIVSTLCGLIFFGIGPATIAVNCVLRQWVRGMEDENLTKQFIHYYKANFKEGALIGLAYLLVGYILVIDLLVVRHLYFKIALYLGIFIYCASLVYISGLIAHYDIVSITKHLKMTLVIALTYLQYTLVTLAICGALIYGVAVVFPGLLLFIGVSGVSLICAVMNAQVFRKVDATVEYAENE